MGSAHYRRLSSEFKVRNVAGATVHNAPIATRAPSVPSRLQDDGAPRVFAPRFARELGLVGFGNLTLENLFVIVGPYREIQRVFNFAAAVGNCGRALRFVGVIWPLYRIASPPRPSRPLPECQPSVGSWTMTRSRRFLPISTTAGENAAPRVTADAVRSTKAALAARQKETSRITRRKGRSGTAESTDHHTLT